ncbi:secreted protein [Cladorrhinum sp. PSN259]|nr:secreted protein [Cladorrhinum sp. PSN259]
MRHITLAAVAVSSSVLFGCPLTAAHPQATPAVPTQNGALVYPFDLSQVQLTSSRWMDNQNRTINYLKFVDVNRMLYVFRQNHKLATQGAAKNGGWDAPDFPFRGHFQGHLLSAWTQCWQTTGDGTCKDRALSFVAELAKCQANNAAAGWNKGYLNAFSEKDFDLLEQGKLSSGVPYYVLHKTMAGLLDVWQAFGDSTAKNVLLDLGGWVDKRTAKLSTEQMQRVLNTEHGGMVAVLTDMYFATGDTNWLTVARRFEHQAVMDPLARNQDQLNGLHANTQIPKWIGALREFKATGTARYKAMASNAWSMVVGAHTYAIGSNSQAEHFKPPNAIAQYLSKDAGETCNTYNMLKLTRELWTLDPSNVGLADYYERALLNQMLGQQNPADGHGHITYFHSMQPGARRGVGPAWGGGTWSTDYDSFWCCQGTGAEAHTKYADSIYFHDDSALYVNLFTPSVLRWSQRGVAVTQSTAFPVSDTSTIKLSALPSSGSSGSNGNWTFAIRIRIPEWASGATVTVNQDAVSGVKAGSYASVSRTWVLGDSITVKLPMSFRLLPANDNKALAAVAYGPTVLVGNYGNSAVSAAPKLQLGSLRRTSDKALEFSATADGKTVALLPYYDGQGINYVTYWGVQGSLPAMA